LPSALLALVGVGGAFSARFSSRTLGARTYGGFSSRGS
jgi:hypothetical protein